MYTNASFKEEMEGARSTVNNTKREVVKIEIEAKRRRGRLRERESGKREKNLRASMAKTCKGDIEQGEEREGLLQSNDGDLLAHVLVVEELLRLVAQAHGHQMSARRKPSERRTRGELPNVNTSAGERPQKSPGKRVSARGVEYLRFSSTYAEVTGVDSAAEGHSKRLQEAIESRQVRSSAMGVRELPHRWRGKRGRDEKLRN